MDVFSLIESKKQNNINTLAVLYVILCKQGVHMTIDEYLEMPAPRLNELFDAIKYVSNEEKKEYDRMRKPSLKGRLGGR